MTQDQQGPRPADAFVAFGISGDLAGKMTFVSLYQLERRGLLDCPIIGVAAENWTDEDLRRRATASATAAPGSHQVEETVLQRLRQRMSYVGGDFAEPSTFARVAKALAGATLPVFYLETPPSLFGPVVQGLAAAGLTEHARVVVEKPLGHDLQSAQELNASLRSIWISRSSIGSTISWGSCLCRTSCICGSRIWCWSRCGTVTTSTACGSPWLRASGRVL
jgi:glucose-6-phosphate 1-dehydrogenase